MNLWCPINKRKKIIIWICGYSNWKINFNSKNNWKRSFSDETKTSISFILMRRMCLWCPVLKKKRLLRESMSIQIDEWTLILKKVEREVFPMKFIPKRRICLWCPIMKRKGLLCESMFIPIDGRTLILKDGGK